jgi:hypothetical protein
VRSDAQTTPLRALGALAVGAGFAGVLTAAIMAAPFSGGTALLPVAAGAFILPAGVTFFVGLLVLGAPLWLAAHRMGRRSVWDAIFLGAVLTAAVFFALTWGGGPDEEILRRFDAQARAEALRGMRLARTSIVVVMALIGAATGALIWRIAYRRTA